MSSLKRHRRSEPHYVYRAFDAYDRLLYVGCTIDFYARVLQHKVGWDRYGNAQRSQAWIWQVARWTVEDYPNVEAANAAELRAIHTEGPLFNRRPSGVRPLPMPAAMNAERATA